MSWDEKAGCWWETCVRDVDVSSEKLAFNSARNSEQASFDLAIRLLDKVYPFGAWILREGSKTPGCGLGSWWAGHIDRSSFDKFVGLATEVHEILHCLHNKHSKFYPGVDRQVLYTQPPYGTWRNEWPTRGEIFNQFGSLLKQDSMLKLYFTNGRAGMADQRLSGFLTECQAYLQDAVSTAWLADGVSSGSYSVKPPVNNNKISDGHPFNLAAWQYASVLYLQRVKSNYAGTWRKMLSGTGKYGEVGKLFLAHHDRFSFLLRLYIDTNGITFRNGFRQKETQEARSLTGRALGKDDVIGQLRATLASGSGSTPTPGSSPTPTPGPSPTPAPGTGSCNDKSGSCNTFVRDGACSIAPEWMRDNCRWSCGWC
jgi:hypothetical protein